MEILELLRAGHWITLETSCFDEMDCGDFEYFYDSEPISDSSVFQYMIWDLLDSGVLTEIEIERTPYWSRSQIIEAQ